MYNLKRILVIGFITSLFFTKAISSEKNITYMQILQKPNDLELNIKYAQQQGKMGNFKQTISTLERLNMVYPDNIEIKMYLLSVLVQADSPDKALTIIDEIKKNRKKKIVILDIPLYLENKMYKSNDVIIFLKTKRKDVNSRLKKRKNFNQKLLNILRKSQLTLKQKKNKSNYVLMNNFNNAIMKRKVKILKTKILNDRSST